MAALGASWRVVWWLVISLFLVGCATRYQPRVPGIFPGYEEEQLGERTYHIRVGPGWPGDRPRLGKFVLYRAAELTVEKGFQYFAMLAGSDFETPVLFFIPATSRTTFGGTYSGTYAGSQGQYGGTTGGFGGSSTSTTWVPMTFSVQWSFIDIRMLEASDITSHSNVIEAQRVIRDLGLFIDRWRP